MMIFFYFALLGVFFPLVPQIICTVNLVSVKSHAQWRIGGIQMDGSDIEKGYRYSGNYNFHILHPQYIDFDIEIGQCPIIDI